MNASQSVNVTKFIDSHPFTGFQWLIFAVCFVIVLLDGFDTAAIGYIAPSLIKEWGVTRPELGPVLSAALFGPCDRRHVCGPLADRLGASSCSSGRLIFGIACFGFRLFGKPRSAHVMRF